MSVLEKIIERIIGYDKMMANKMFATALITKSEKSPGHVWADYMFLAACYGSIAGDGKIEKKAIEEIKKDFPNYDPSKRFRWEDTGIDYLEADDIKEKAPNFEEMRYRIPMVGHMNRFCEKHPDFSFKDAMDKYFPEAAKMHIKKKSEKQEGWTFRQDLSEE